MTGRIFRYRQELLERDQQAALETLKLFTVWITIAALVSLFF